MRFKRGEPSAEEKVNACLSLHTTQRKPSVWQGCSAKAQRAWDSSGLQKIHTPVFILPFITAFSLSLCSLFLSTQLWLNPWLLFSACAGVPALAGGWVVSHLQTQEYLPRPSGKWQFSLCDHPPTNLALNCDFFSLVVLKHLIMNWVLMKPRSRKKDPSVLRVCWSHLFHAEVWWVCFAPF